MTVATEQLVSLRGLYTPFRGFDRELGPVGTLYVDAEAAGAAGGGTVTILLNMSSDEFGFHGIWVPTRVSSRDALATAETVALTYRNEGNERLSSDITEQALAVVTPSQGNVATFNDLAVIIEPDIIEGDRVLSCQWSTNEDGDTYHLHVFGVLYDAQAMARGKLGRVAGDLLAGIR